VEDEGEDQDQDQGEDEVEDQEQDQVQVQDPDRRGREGWSVSWSEDRVARDDVHRYDARRAVAHQQVAPGHHLAVADLDQRRRLVKV
jgi:hypothetical protein